MVHKYRTHVHGTRLLQLLRTFLLQALFPDERQLGAFLSMTADDFYSTISVRTSSGITSIFPYRDARIRAGIHALKYKADRRPAQLVAPHIAKYVHAYAQTLKAPLCIVPLPASPRRLQLYGFNQCALLAKAVTEVLTQEFPDLRWSLAPSAIYRIRGDESQTKLGKAARAKAVMGAFVGTEVLADMHVVILDDVVTTGATARAVVAAATAARAASAIVITIAH